jgi:uncharacterized protein (TIGR03066 family)
MSKSTSKKRPASHDKENPHPSTKSPPTSASLWYRGLLFVVILAATGGGTWAMLEYVVLAKLPAALVGKWVVKGGGQDGATFDFYRNGRMVGRVNVDGREGIIDARVRVESDQLLTTTRNPRTGQDETRQQTIQELTDKNLVLVDDDKQILRMTRAE